MLKVHSSGELFEEGPAATHHS